MIVKKDSAVPFSSHLFLPPGLALHALTVTLPDEIAASSAVPASARATPVAPPASNSATSKEEDQESDQSDTADAAAARSSSNVLAGSNQRAGHPPLPVPDNQQHELNATACSVGTTAIPPLRRQVEPHPHKREKQAHLRRSPMPLSSLLSSPSLLDSLPSNTEQSDEEEGASDGGGRDEGPGRRGANRGGNYRSVCSCPAIGATGASPLFARHDLTDRSALERSQQLVSSIRVAKPVLAWF